MPHRFNPVASRSLLIAAAFVSAGATSQAARALQADARPAAIALLPSWTQWGGPSRDFCIDDPGIAADWPAAGPKQLWKRALGDGYSCLISNGHRLFTMYRPESGPDKGSEIIVALEGKSGVTVWEYKYPAPYINDGEERKQTFEFGTGPNSTPLLVGNRLYAVGFTGLLHCLDAWTGKLIWSHDLYREFKGTFMICGYAASPIAYKETIICPVGGKGHGLMAFDRATGKVAWSGLDFDAAYASPMLMQVNGHDHLVAYMARNVVGVDPADGKLHWSVEHRNPMNDNCICTPVACPGQCVYVANFGETGGGRMLKLATRDGHVSATDLWLNKKITGGLSDVVRIGDTLYGPHTSKSFAAFSAVSGEIAWQDRAFARTIVVKVGEKLLLLDENGNLMLGRAGAKGIELHGKAALLEKSSWTAPTLVGRTLFLRDRKHVMAVDLG